MPNLSPAARARWSSAEVLHALTASGMPDSHARAVVAEAEAGLTYPDAPAARWVRRAPALAEVLSITPAEFETIEGLDAWGLFQALTPRGSSALLEVLVSIPCPNCQARPGSKCTQATDTSRREVPWVHHSRRAEALDAYRQGAR